jgi:gp021
MTNELVKKSKKQYGKDLASTRLKAYNRLYRKPFGRSELKHYGILGMKWGKRKDKQSGSSSSPKSSEHYNSLVSKYSQKGYSPQESARRAKNRIRAEKTLLAVGGTALAAAGAYVAYKKYVKDTVLPSSTIFKQYGSFKPGQPIGNHRNDSFVYDKSDVKGRYGNVRKIQEYLRKDKQGKVFELNSKFDKATTVASPKKARDAFVDKFKNDRYFREDLSEALKRTHAGTDKQDKSVMALRKALSGKKKFLRGDAYDGFTKILKDDNKYANDVKLSYFKDLKKQGVNAIVDRDAKKLARTRAKSPIIRYGTWGTIPSPEHVTKEHVNYLKNKFKQQRTIKGRIRQVLNEGSKLIGKRK